MSVTLINIVYVRLFKGHTVRGRLRGSARLLESNVRNLTSFGSGFVSLSDPH
jgi:hypothetical protein